jgi:predicted acetylornithine/succinylornithine family transaminase
MSSETKTSFLIQNYARQDVMFVSGEGCYLTDERGRRYLDAFAGVAVSALGHGHPALAEAISRQARVLLHTSNHYFIEGQEEWARALVTNAFPSRAFFCNSGGEANEAAYKLVRLWGNATHAGRKRRILAFQGGFHGRTLGALSITGTPAYREPFEPLPPAEFLPYGDRRALEQVMGDDVAGVFIEPIQGEGGVNVPPPGFFSALREACTRHGALLVVDEVQTGIGRTGRFFGYQHEGVTPDVMTLAKGIAGGVPAGAMLAREEIAALIKPGLHASTFGGNPLACAAARAVIREVSKPGFLENVAARGAQLMEGLRRIFGPEREVRGRGLLLGVQLTEPPQRWITAAREEGLIVGPSGGNTLRLAPPLVLTEGEAEEILHKLAGVRRRLEG